MDHDDPFTDGGLSRSLPLPPTKYDEYTVKVPKPQTGDDPVFLSESYAAEPELSASSHDVLPAPASSHDQLPTIPSGDTLIDPVNLSESDVETKRLPYENLKSWNLKFRKSRINQTKLSASSHDVHIPAPARISSTEKKAKKIERNKNKKNKNKKKTMLTPLFSVTSGTITEVTSDSSTEVTSDSSTEGSVVNIVFKMISGKEFLLKVNTGERVDVVFQRIAKEIGDDNVVADSLKLINARTEKICTSANRDASFLEECLEGVSAARGTTDIFDVIVTAAPMKEVRFDLTEKGPGGWRTSEFSLFLSKQDTVEEVFQRIAEKIGEEDGTKILIRAVQFMFNMRDGFLWGELNLNLVNLHGLEITCLPFVLLVATLVPAFPLRFFQSQLSSYRDIPIFTVEVYRNPEHCARTW